MSEFKKLVNRIQTCTICASHLEHGVRPVIQIDPQAKILIASQAPGKKVHLSGVPFDDVSGDRLRDWMDISKGDFYNASNIAILPMGFCYPGSGKSGDLPPRPECAIAWRKQLMSQLKQLQLTLVIGKYAQTYHLNNNLPVTENVKSWKAYWPGILPLPHPSPRNKIWLKRNPWFEVEVLPKLRKRIKMLINV